MSPMNALDPAGPQAARIADLFWVQLGLCGAVYVLVISTLVWAVLRRRRPAPGDEVAEKRVRTAVAGATAVTIATMVSLLFASVSTGRALDGLGGEGAEEPLVIQITGHQWWWEIRYPDPDPDQEATTANELHIPVGRAVRLELKSADVIHSLWIPELHGKRDLIPSYPSALLLRADRAGTYFGQCAEFCGTQHANMRITVIAEPQAKLDAWLQHLRSPAEEPASAEAKRGKEVFLGGPCAMCHTVSGTRAAATRGPDLTHVASRQTIAAGTRPNTRGHLAGWVLDPQSTKPGNMMPSTSLGGDDLQALLAYLETLR